jgi:tRNA threonylcarbamoyladenosine biosynthesis protein TsaB
MASLAQLLASHRRILVLDAASARVQVGLLGADQPAVWHAADAEAGAAVFSGTSALLTPAGLRLEDIAAFAYCEGPGSMLGIRTVAMTLRTWTTLQSRPVYRYQSLALAARHEWSKHPRALGVIADARRETWHHQAITAGGALAPLQRVPATELADGDLVTPEFFRAWAKTPQPVATCSYDLAALFATSPDEDLFTATAAPDAFQHEAPDYKKWSALPHSAETAKPR